MNQSLTSSVEPAELRSQRTLELPDVGPPCQLDFLRQIQQYRLLDHCGRDRAQNPKPVTRLVLLVQSSELTQVVEVGLFPILVHVLRKPIVAKVGPRLHFLHVIRELLW